MKKLLFYFLTALLTVSMSVAAATATSGQSARTGVSDGERPHIFFLQVRKDAGPQALYSKDANLKLLPVLLPGAWVQIELNSYEVKQKLIDEANGQVDARIVKAFVDGRETELLVNDDYRNFQTWNPRLTPIYFQSSLQNIAKPIAIFADGTVESQKRCEADAQSCVARLKRDTEFWLTEIRIILLPDKVKTLYRVSFLEPSSDNRRMYGWLDSSDIQFEISEPAKEHIAFRPKTLAEEVGISVIKNFDADLGYHSFVTSGEQNQKVDYLGLDLGGQVGGYLIDNVETLVGLWTDFPLHRISGDKSMPILVNVSQEVLYAPNRKASHRWQFGVEGDVIAQLPANGVDAFNALLGARGIINYEIPHWQFGYHGGIAATAASAHVSNDWLEFKVIYHDAPQPENYGWAYHFDISRIYFSNTQTDVLTQVWSCLVGLQNQF